MQVQLVMFRDGGEHRPFTLSKGMTVIGRREDCDLRIAVGDVSRKHCRVIQEDGVRVEDLGSSNGTFVNGHRVQSSPLSAGDTLQVGPVVFVVQVDGEPAIDDMTPRTTATVAAASSARGHGAAAHAPAARKPQAIDDEIGDIDELEILNDSGGGDDAIDLDPAEQ